MNKNELEKLLHEQNEKDHFDFKQELNLYSSEGKLIDRQRDELIKDILGLANGNSSIIRKTKYLLIGVDDKKFDKNQQRVLHSVESKVPTVNELIEILRNAVSPAIVGLECEYILYGENKLFIISIPPTFDLHETTRELKTNNSTFQKFTVFMRQGEHTIPASFRDGRIIQDLKHLFRREINNPPAVVLGGTIGGLIAFIIGSATLNSSPKTLFINEYWSTVLLVVLGVLFGLAIGYFFNQINQIRYDLRYFGWKKKIIFISLLIGLSIYAFIFLKK